MNNNYKAQSYSKFKNDCLNSNIKSKYVDDNIFRLNTLEKYNINPIEYHQNYNYDSLIPIFDINSDFDVNHRLSDILYATTDDLFQPDFYVDTKIAENYLEDPLIPFLVNKQYDSIDHVYLAAEAVTNKNLQDRLFNLNCIHSDDYRGFYFDNLNQDTAYVAFRGTYLNFLENPLKAADEGIQAMQQWLLPIQTFEFLSPDVRNNNIEWFENQCIPILQGKGIEKVIVGSHSAQAETATEITNRLSIKYPDIEFINVPINQWTTNKSNVLANDKNTYHIRDPNDWISTPNVNSNLKDEYKRIKTKGSLWSSLSLEHHKLNHLLSSLVAQVI